MVSGNKKKNIRPKLDDAIKDKVTHERLKRLKSHYVIHSVTELRRRGMVVKHNSTNSFKDVTFESNCSSGTLRFPVDHVDFGSKSALSNIIAYEMSPENRSQDFTMTAYVHVMKSLLQSPKDVEELHSNGIILNMLGNNEDVMNIYEDIYTEGTTNSIEYTDICQKMQVYYNTRKTWLAEFKETYFRTPWTVITLFGSVAIVILTFMQTYYAATEGNKNCDKGK